MHRWRASPAVRRTRLGERRWRTLSPTPLLMLVAREDHLTPSEFSIAAFQRVNEPRKLVIMPGGHFDA